MVLIMVQAILGKKIGMTQVFTERGTVVPVTVIEAGPCIVTHIKTAEKDGYEAVQIGFEEAKAQRIKRPERGHLKAALGDNILNIEKPKKPEDQLMALRHLREVQADNIGDYKIGDRIVAGSVFAAGERVDVIGTSKGKGFQGVMKRHHFHGGPATHGQSDRRRAPGSIGSGTTPGRVFKGMRMAGRTGGDRITTQNLEIVRIDAERNLVLIKGAVPGADGGLVMIRKAVKGISR